MILERVRQKFEHQVGGQAISPRKSQRFRLRRLQQRDQDIHPEGLETAQFCEKLFITVWIRHGREKALLEVSDYVNLRRHVDHVSKSFIERQLLVKSRRAVGPQSRKFING